MIRRILEKSRGDIDHIGFAAWLMERLWALLVLFVIADVLSRGAIGNFVTGPTSEERRQSRLETLEYLREVAPEFHHCILVEFEGEVCAEWANEPIDPMWR